MLNDHPPLSPLSWYNLYPRWATSPLEYDLLNIEEYNSFETSDICHVYGAWREDTNICLGGEGHALISEMPSVFFFFLSCKFEPK